MSMRAPELALNRSPVRQARRMGPHGKSRPNLVLAVCSLGLFLVGMDVTIVNVALPAIQQNLGAEFSGLQWVIDAYLLVVASLLLLTGSLADRFGRRRTFQLGLVIFTLGSFLCSVAPDVRALIACRALQGLGASMLNPVALAIIVNAFPNRRARAHAIGIWGAVFGIALAAGPLIGGVLTQTVGWRFIFLINVPVGLMAVALTALFVPESKSPHPHAIDPVGQLLVMLMLSCLTYAVIEGQHFGWRSISTIGLLGTAGASLIGIVFYEPRLREPLIDLRFFRSAPFSGATLIAAVAFGSFGVLLFLGALYLQQERGFSAFKAGLCTLPLAVAAMIFGVISGRWVGSHGTRPSLLAGGMAMLLSMLLLTGLNDCTSVRVVLLMYTLFGGGLGMVNPAISTVAVSGMPSSRAGVAAAVAATSRQVGASLGVAIAGAVVTARRSHGMSFAIATHPIWWGLAACGGLIVVLGWATNTERAQESARHAMRFHASTD